MLFHRSTYQRKLWKKPRYNYPFYYVALQLQLGKVIFLFDIMLSMVLFYLLVAWPRTRLLLLYGIA